MLSYQAHVGQHSNEGNRTVRVNRTLSVIVAAGLLLGGANLAVYAANGRSLVLGKVNKERPARPPSRTPAPVRL